MCQFPFLRYHKSLGTGVVPDEWKLANIVPVYKKRDREHAENYRPISRLSLVSKVFERCIFNTIKGHVFRQVNPCQHGFVSRRSCSTQLIEVIEHTRRLLDRGKEVDVIYLDMSKAFDEVSHKRILSRLRDFGFGANILKWFSSYLDNRYQQTTAFGVTSEPLLVTSGVPQGSILGPMLFLFYENDLTSAVTDSNIKMFADDTKLFKEISSVADATQLNNDLSNFQKSSFNAGLKLNISKCKSMQITRKHHPIEFTNKLQCANGEAVIERTEQERDLGVWTTSNLRWSKQVSEQCVRGNKMLGYIKRLTHNIKSLAARRTV